MRRAVLVVVFVVLAACGSDDEGTTESSSADESTTTTAAVTTTAPNATADESDPYETYLQLAPAGEEKLGREDAQARAYLGCEQQWAPGTTDRALADAYRPTGICDR